MNQDPKRLLLDPDLAPELGEQLKQFDQHCQGQPFDLNAGLARFEAAMSATPTSAASAGAGVKSAASSAALTGAGAAAPTGVGVTSGSALLTGIKGALAVGALAGAGALVWTSWPTSPSSTEAPTASAKTSFTQPEPPSPTRPALAQPGSSPVTLKENPLQAELAVVRKARQALFAGHAKKALVLLQDSQEKFAKGALVPEREALLIIALSQSGQARNAKSKARRFLAKHPESPMANRVRQILGKSSRRPKR